MTNERSLCQDLLFSGFVPYPSVNSSPRDVFLLREHGQWETAFIKTFNWSDIFAFGESHKTEFWPLFDFLTSYRPNEPETKKFSWGPGSDWLSCRCIRSVRGKFSILGFYVVSGRSERFWTDTARVEPQLRVEPWNCPDNYDSTVPEKFRLT